MATPGRAKQAKVKSASLVKALLTTHPQGEVLGKLSGTLQSPPSFSPAPGCAPAAATARPHGAAAARRPRAPTPEPPAPSTHPAGPQLLEETNSLPNHFGMFRSRAEVRGFFLLLFQPLIGSKLGGEGVGKGEKAILEINNKSCRKPFYFFFFKD